jgi:hypothetical protein
MKSVVQYSRVRVLKIREDIDYTINDADVAVGDVGTVLEVYSSADQSMAYDVECVKENGAWLATLYEDEIVLVQ